MVLAASGVIITGAVLGWALFSSGQHGDAHRKAASTATAVLGRTSPGASTRTSGPAAPTKPGLTAVPTGSAAAALCTGATSTYGVAGTYVGLAEIGRVQAAQACVFHGTVAASITARLTGKTFLTKNADTNATVIEFEATDRSTRLTVTTAKEPDGRYYVTAVVIS